NSSWTPGTGALAEAAAARTDRGRLGPWLAVHRLGLRASAVRGRVARPDGPGRLGPGQCDDGVLRDAPAGTARQPGLEHAPQAGAAIFEGSEGWYNPRRRPRPRGPREEARSRSAS